MSGLAIVLILISSFFHAGWNLVSKQSYPTPAFFLLANVTGALLFLPWVLVYHSILSEMPAMVWLFLLITGLFQATYCIALASAYRHGELSIAYPVARSLPVILVPVATLLLGRGELLGAWFWLGVCLVLAGASMLSAEEISGLKHRRLQRSAIAMAVWAAAGTAGYSMVDDRALSLLRNTLGGHLGTVPITLVYAFVEALTCAGWIGLFILLFRQGNVRARVPVRRAVGAGILMYLTYGLVLLSMAYARDISLIVAFRQVSILIGAFMGMVILKEKAHRWKLIGLGFMFAGLIIVAVN